MIKVKYWLIVFGLMLLRLSGAHALEQTELLSPEQAFQLTVTAPDAATVLAEWSIAAGYYLYRERFRFTATTPGIRLGEPHFPAGKIKEDKFLAGWKAIAARSRSPFRWSATPTPRRN